MTSTDRSPFHSFCSWRSKNSVPNQHFRAKYLDTQIKCIFLDANGLYDVICKRSVLLMGGMKLNSKKKQNKTKNKEIKILNIFCNMILSHQALVYVYSFFFFFVFFSGILSLDDPHWLPNTTFQIMDQNPCSLFTLWMRFLIENLENLR